MSKSAPRRPVVLCAVQDAPQSFDLEASLTRLETLAEKAVEESRQAATSKWGSGVNQGSSSDGPVINYETVVVFPEGFLSAYPRGMDFGAVIGSRSKEGREWYRRYVESSVPVADSDGAVMKRIRGVASRLKITMVIGVIERCDCDVTVGVGEPPREAWAAKEKGGGGTIYCTSLTISPTGAILSSRRKLQPTALERFVWGQGSASDISVAVSNSPAGKIGSAICWENYMPLLRYKLYEKGTQIWCAPTADTRDQWAGTMTHIALEGRVFVISCCQYAEKKDFPEDYPAYQDEAPDHMVTRGGSMIVSPLGEVLAGPLFNQRGIITACVDDVDGQILEAKLDMDACGHYGRQDLFQLRVTGE
ncbi:unnamed protein product [Sympodiomycopsis kandeliae]